MKDQIQITQDNFIRLLEEEFPDKHTDVLHHIEENGEVLFHILCNDVIETPLEELLSENKDTDIIKKYCDFIERMWKFGNEDIINILDVTVFEGLAQDDKIWQTFGQYISQECKDYINNDLISWNVMMFLCKRII